MNFKELAQLGLVILIALCISYAFQAGIMSMASKAGTKKS